MPSIRCSIPSPCQPGSPRPQRMSKRRSVEWVDTDKFTIDAKAPLSVTNPVLAGAAGQEPLFLCRRR